MNFETPIFRGFVSSIFAGAGLRIFMAGVLITYQCENKTQCIKGTIPIIFALPFMTVPIIMSLPMENWEIAIIGYSLAFIYNVIARIKSNLHMCQGNNPCQMVNCNRKKTQQMHKMQTENDMNNSNHSNLNVDKYTTNHIRNNDLKEITQK